MTFHIRRPRQVVGIIYIILYIVIFFAYGVIHNTDQSWSVESKFAVMVILWFILSLAVKISMAMDRSIELLNLIATVAFMSIGFTYYPQPDDFSSIESFCYYLNIFGGSACDFFDFVYEGAAKRPEDTSIDRQNRISLKNNR